MPENERNEIIIRELYDGIRPLFPGEYPDMILFGSYARGNYENGSDIDIMVLVDSSREEIAQKNWQVGDIAGNLLIEHGVLVSPIVENRFWFNNNAKVVPLFKNILQEGRIIVPEVNSYLKSQY